MAQFLKGLDGEPIQRGGQNILSSVQGNIVKTVDIKTRTLIMKGTSEHVDRDGDIVRLNGIQLENYLKNPVFLWAHDYKSVPLGATTRLVKRRLPDPHMEFHIKFPSEGLNPFADMILGLYHEKIVNASSIGFIPLETITRIPGEGEKADRFWNPKEFLKSELLELSGCAVPCNPNAVQNALKGKSFDGLDMKGLLQVLEQGLPMPEVGRKDDILGELLGKTLLIEEEDRPVQVQVPVQLESKEQDPEEAPENSGTETIKEEVVEVLESDEEVPGKDADPLDLKLEKVLEKIIGLEKELNHLTNLVRGLVETKGSKDEGEKEGSDLYESLLETPAKVAPEEGAMAEGTPQQDLEKALAPFTNQLSEIAKNLKGLVKR